MKNKGKLIVIDGSDSSGKATQTALLVKKLKRKGYKTATLDFPRYYENFFGNMVGAFLRGEFGNINQVNPYLASLLYAADRWESKYKLEKWLKDGKIVVLDRYVSANEIHQTVKIKNKKEKMKYLRWLYKLEFKTFKIPKPDLVIYLFVPVKFIQKLRKDVKDKKYLKGKKDIHESNISYLKKVERQAKSLARRKNWRMINCVKKGKMLSREEISEKVWNKVKNFL